MQEPLLAYTPDQRPPEGYGFIYSITSPSGKRYVGQTRHSVRQRFNEHARHPKMCRAIGRAIVKYGAENFSLQILECVPLKALNSEEVHQIVKYGSIRPDGYNLNSGGKQCAVLSDEAKDRIRRAHLKSAKARRHLKELIRLGTGRPCAAATRAKLAASLVGRKNGPHTADTSRKQSVARKRYCLTHVKIGNRWFERSKIQHEVQNEQDKKTA